MLDAPRHGEAVTDERERCGELDGSLGAILRIFESELALGFVEGHCQ
jgi:hypothetical protein